MYSVYLTKVSALLLSSISTFARGQNAYLDPGSGSYLLQLLLAGLVGGALVIRASWDNVKNFFRKLFTRGKESSTDDE
jgi:hypothetical protein